MSIEKAKKHFLGKEGHARLNCVQSILTAFKDKVSFDEKTMAKLASYGGGNAPEGLCGAYYAAKCLLEKNLPNKLQELETFFRNAAGSLKCKEIRQMKKLSCLGCVEKAAEFVDRFH